jgi:lysophospholipase L1-like esterase
MNILDSKYFHYSGRILKTKDSAYLGFTNSKIEFYTQANESNNSIIQIIIETKLNGDINNARLKVLIDSKEYPNNLLILDKEQNTFSIPLPTDPNVHQVTIIKITEAGMSYAKIKDISILDGNIIPYPSENDTRLKVEFIGDSITCGYGVYGEPDSEYNISDEDGMVTYAALTANALNLNAQYFSVSGFGMYIKYDGDLDGVIPKIYEHTNYFVDTDTLYNFEEFKPDLYVINLGTNDSGHLDNEINQRHFVESYVEFIKRLKNKSPNAKILCMIGTLCTNVFSFIEEAVQIAEKQGFTDLYTFELPYHDIERDGIASGHPSLTTHQKDSIRLTEKIKQIFPQDFSK